LNGVKNSTNHAEGDERKVLTMAVENEIKPTKKKTRKKRATKKATTKKIEGNNPHKKVTRWKRRIVPSVTKGQSRQFDVFNQALAIYLDTCGMSPSEAYFLGCSITALSEELESINPPVMKRLISLLTGKPDNVNLLHIENTPDL